MPRSHPPTLITLADRALVDEIGVQKGQRVLAAVSGGVDSMALLSVLARLAPKRGFFLVAHGVDHGLRTEAAAELDRARDFARELRVPFERTCLTVPPGGNLQARARTARHAALREAADECGANWIATAHHADDRAETVLIRLLRGTSPAGLGVLPPRDGDRIRPLIRARKTDVLAHVARHNVPFTDDPSNENLRFVRVRVRKQLLPLLETLSPRVVEHLNALADDLVEQRQVEQRQEDSVNTPMKKLTPELLLGAAQRAEVRRMIAHRSSSTRVRLRGGKDLALGPDGAVLVEEPDTKR